MRVLVTGVAGFIGSHLADALIAQGHEVVGIDDLSTGRAANVPDGVRLIIGDVAGMTDVGWIDAIYHCAASYRDREAWERDARTNVLGSIAVAREAKRSGARVIYFQTSLCYGPNPASPVQTDAPLAPEGSYAVSKTAGSNYLRDAGIDLVELRLANIYGPRNLSGPIPTFYQRLDAGKPVTIVDSRRDFVYIDDLVRVALAALTEGQGPYHVASGGDHAILDIYTEITDAMGLAVPPPEVTPRGRDDVATLLLDPSRTYDTFGWQAVTPLAVGIGRAVEWYRTHPVTETFTHLALRG